MRLQEDTTWTSLRLSLQQAWGAEAECLRRSWGPSRGEERPRRLPGCSRLPGLSCGVQGEERDWGGLERALQSRGVAELRAVAAGKETPGQTLRRRGRRDLGQTQTTGSKGGARDRREIVMGSEKAQAGGKGAEDSCQEEVRGRDRCQGRRLGPRWRERDKLQFGSHPHSLQVEGRGVLSTHTLRDKAAGTPRSILCPSARVYGQHPPPPVGTIVFIRAAFYVIRAPPPSPLIPRAPLVAV